MKNNDLGAPLALQTHGDVAARNLSNVTARLLMNRAISSPHFRFPSRPGTEIDPAAEPQEAGSDPIALLQRSQGRSQSRAEIEVSQHRAPEVAVRKHGNRMLRIDPPHPSHSPANSRPATTESTSVEDYLGWSEVSAEPLRAAIPLVDRTLQSVTGIGRKEPAEIAGDPKAEALAQRLPAFGTTGEPFGKALPVSRETTAQFGSGRSESGNPESRGSITGPIMGQVIPEKAALQANREPVRHDIPAGSSDVEPRRTASVPVVAIGAAQIHRPPAFIQTPVTGGTEKRLTVPGRRKQLSTYGDGATPPEHSKSDSAPTRVAADPADSVPATPIDSPITAREGKADYLVIQAAAPRLVAANSKRATPPFEAIPLFPEPVWPVVTDLLLGAGWPFISRMAEGMDRIAAGKTDRIVVTGVDRAVGTTTIALTLARWAVANKRRVLLVDADLQSAGLSQILGRNPARLWPAAGRGEHLVRQGMIRSSRSGIAFATTGQLKNRQLWPPFVLDRLSELLDSVTGLFDLVLVDAGPVHQVVAELSSMEKLSPCALLVSAGKEQDELLIQAACQRLGELGAQRVLAARNFSNQPLLAQNTLAQKTTAA